MAPDLRDHIQSMLGSGYRLSKELGGAGMSRVFIADDEALGQRVVVKVLPPELAAGVNIDRFKREIQVAAQLHHPNIVPVLSAGQTSELLWYSMPLIKGETLRALLEREHQLPLETALGFARDVASALTSAHEQNIVHRDIKPENILIENGRALVADFGIARAIEKSVTVLSVTSTGLTLGTPTYMSPEQAAAEKRIDGRSDIYSLGCVVYEMFAGEPPFTGPSARSVIAKHINERPPSVLTTRPNLPPHVEKALYIALAKAPADRFATAQEFAEALDSPAVTSERPIPAWPRKRRVRTALVALLVAVAVLLLAWPPSRPARARAGPPADLDPTHIAVLYLDAPPADTQLATIARGITRDLITALQHVEPLRVISADGLRNVRGDAPIDSLAQRLNAGTIVTGSMERQGDSLLVELRFVDPRTLVQTDAVRARYASAKMVLMRDSVVRQVTDSLRSRLGRAVLLRQWQSHTSSDRAWMLRQQAEEQVQYEDQMPAPGGETQLHVAVLRHADSLLTLAARADTTWAEPVLARARLRLRLSRIVPPSVASAMLDTGFLFVTQALARSPGDPAALTVRGQLFYRRWLTRGSGTAGLLDSAESDLVMVTSAEPTDAQAWNALSRVRRLKGNISGAVAAVHRAMDVDAYLRDLPESLDALIYAYLFARQYPAARSLCAEAVRRYPENSRVRTCELGVLAWSGRGDRDIARAWQLVQEAERNPPWPLTAGISPEARFYTAAILARSDLRDSARHVAAATRRTLTAAGKPLQALEIEAYVFVLLGDREAALAAIGDAVRANPGLRDGFATLPWFESLRSDGRFRALVAR